MLPLGVKEISFNKSKKTIILRKRLYSNLEAIKYCINKFQPYPAAILIYCTIDACGSILSKDGRSTHKNFKAWVKKYLFKIKSFAFTEDELWSARCGLVHTLKYESDKQQRLIIYGIYKYDQNIKNIIDHTKYVGIHLEDLYDGLVQACELFLSYMESSSDHDYENNLKKLPQDYIDVIPLEW